MRKFLVLLLALTALCCSIPPDTETRAELRADFGFAETRALWVTRFELNSPENIPVLVKRAAEANFNTLFVQVCGRGTAFYDSQILPRDTRATDFDALALTLAEAKKHGISVHAWINTLYVWSDAEPPVSPEHVVNKNPEWIMTLRGNSKDKYLDPSIPEVQEYLKSVYLEVARNYEVDGVHLDYVRYPGTWSGFTKYSRQSFEQLTGVDPLALYQNKEIALRLFGQDAYNQYIALWDSYRRDAVNTLVRTIFRELTINAPDVLLSAAVMPDPKSAAEVNFQDWESWMHSGYIDTIVPMVYDMDYNVVQKQAAKAAELSARYSIPVYIGLGAWRRSAEAIAADVEFVRKLSAGGVVLFSYDGIKNPPDYLDNLRRKVFTRSVERTPPREHRVFSEESAVKDTAG